MTNQTPEIGKICILSDKEKKKLIDEMVGICEYVRDVITCARNSTRPNVLYAISKDIKEVLKKYEEEK